MWAAGTYEEHEVVNHQQNAWVCIVPTTTQEPSLANVLGSTSDWFPLSINPWGFGRMWLSAPDLGFPDLGGGWQTVTYDSSDFAQNTTLTPATGTIQFDYPGVWECNVQLSFLHNSSNSGRLTNLRLSDGTTQTGVFPIGIGRNAESSNASVNIWVSITDANIGGGFFVEIGGGDAVTVDEMTVAALSAKKLA